MHGRHRFWAIRPDQERSLYSSCTYERVASCCEQLSTFPSRIIPVASPSDRSSSRNRSIDIIPPVISPRNPSMALFPGSTACRPPASLRSTRDTAEDCLSHQSIKNAIYRSFTEYIRPIWSIEHARIVPACMQATVVSYSTEKSR